jgi:hypothetical protein
VLLLLAQDNDLEGYILLVVSSKGGVQFTRTTEEVARYAGGGGYSVVGAYVRTAILTMTEQVQYRYDPQHLLVGYTEWDSTCGRPS